MFLEAPRLEIYEDAASDETFTSDQCSFEQPPEDLRSRIDEHELARLVQCSVERVAHYIGSSDYTPDREPWLGVLTYFYAIGIYGSDEVAAELADNPDLNALYPVPYQNAEPEALFRRFRRANRVALVNCLSAVLSHVWSCRSDTDVEIEAARRVMNAIRADSYALDF
jgi:hypothetical protein